MRILSSFLSVLASMFVFFGVPTAFAAQPAPTPTTHTIIIQGMRFIPDTLNVAPGDTVVWTNQDNVPHTATATDINRTFDTGVIPPGSSFTMVMTAVGTFPYACTIHPQMLASLAVTNAPTLPPAPPVPAPAPPTSPYLQKGASH